MLSYHDIVLNPFEILVVALDGKPLKVQAAKLDLHLILAGLTSKFLATRPWCLSEFLT